MIKVRKKFIGTKIKSSELDLILNNDLSQKLLNRIHEKYNKRFTYKSKSVKRKKKYNYDKDNKGSN